MKKHFINTMAGTFVKTFLSGCLAVYISNGKDIFSYDASMWKSVMGAGISAVVIVGYNYLNPNDPRYGKNKSTEIIDK